jgi:hypothetical protein
MEPNLFLCLCAAKLWQYVQVQEGVAKKKKNQEKAKQN